ncbi:hypothetical protein DFH09DRAFT_1423513 [Mycena vulgaris]|nr:hypothetical protein DFH09DRAFT_1423513 [Mycena vulgaris]
MKDLFKVPTAENVTALEFLALPLLLGLSAPPSFAFNPSPSTLHLPLFRLLVSSSLQHHLHLHRPQSGATFRNTRRLRPKAPSNSHLLHSSTYDPSPSPLPSYRLYYKNARPPAPYAPDNRPSTSHGSFPAPSSKKPTRNLPGVLALVSSILVGMKNNTPTVLQLRCGIRQHERLSKVATTENTTAPELPALPLFLGHPRPAPHPSPTLPATFNATFIFIDLNPARLSEMTAACDRSIIRLPFPALQRPTTQPHLLRRAIAFSPRTPRPPSPSTSHGSSPAPSPTRPQEADAEPAQAALSLYQADSAGLLMKNKKEDRKPTTAGTVWAAYPPGVAFISPLDSSETFAPV